MDQLFFYSVAHTRHCAWWSFRRVIRLYKRLPFKRPRKLPLKEELKAAREWRKFTRGRYYK